MMENYKQNYIHKPYLFLAILFSLLSCQKEVVSKVTFERKLSGIKPETEFRLDSLRNDKWQKCYIIPSEIAFSFILFKSCFLNFILFNVELYC